MTYFICVCFFGRVNLKQVEEKNSSRKSGGMLSLQNFKILHGVMAFLVFFELILIKLFASHSESFTKYDAFCPNIFDLCVLTSGKE